MAGLTLPTEARGYSYDGARRLLELNLSTSRVVCDYLDSPTGELAAVGAVWLLGDETGSVRSLARHAPGGRSPVRAS